MSNKKEYSPQLKNKLSRIYKMILKHKNGEFTKDNILYYTEVNDKFIEKFIDELDLIKTIVEKQPYKTVNYISIERDPNDADEKIDVIKETRTFFDYDLRELEYSVKLIGRNYHRTDLIKTNIS